MTTIKLLDKNALSIALFNAMCEQMGENGDILTHFKIEANGDASTVNLKILVNNVEVDLVPELVRFIQSLDAQFEAAVEKKAKELIMKDQILQDLAYAIQNAEWAIQDRLDKITQRP